MSRRRPGPPRLDDRPRVAVIHHYFAHYREAVLRELSTSQRFAYDFFADSVEYRGQAIPGMPIGRGSPIVRPQRCRRLLGPVMWQSGLLRLASRGDYEAFILLGNVYWPATWIALLILKIRRKPAWLWTHGWVGPDRLLPGLIRRRFYRLATGLLLYGHYAKDHAIQIGFPADRLQVIRNSLAAETVGSTGDAGDSPTASASTATATPATADASPTIICVTRLLPERHLADLLAALAILRAESLPVHLILVGAGTEEPALREQAAHLKVSVHFEGACYDPARLANLYNSASACVVPRNVGLLAIHALSHGCPVITLDDWTRQFPEFEAVVPGVTGYLTADDTPAELARIIKALVNDSSDRDRWTASCQDLVRRFYSPAFQRASIEWILDGNPADDLFLMQPSLART